MKKQFFTLLLLLPVFLLTKYGFSQTIINYETWNGASGCNIFANVTNVPATVNGTNTTIPHLTAIGQPAYNTVNHSVDLDAKIVSAINYGTEYRITTTFKQGYSYVITVNAAKTMVTPTGPNVMLRLDMNNGGSGSNTQCNGPGFIDASQSGGLKQSQQIGSGVFTNYVFNYVSLSAQQIYLMVAAIPVVGQVDQTIHIRKITITEIAPPFQITPTPVSISCGYPITQTFTVNNQGGVTGITGYVWDLGTTPNGWIYSGSAAPQIINTVGNTLQLTSVCGATASKNVSSTVYVSGNPFITVTATVNFNPNLPTYTVNGSATICNATPVTYNIVEALPCDGSVSWTATPAGIVSLNPVGNTVQVTKTGNGTVTLTGTVTSACGSKSATKSINVGAPVVNVLDEIASFCLAGRNVKVQVNPIDPNASYTWSVTSPATVSPVSGSPFTVVRSVSVPRVVTVTVQATNGCGTSSYQQSVFLPSCSGFRVADTSPLSFDVSPNPVKNNFTVTIREDGEATGIKGNVVIKLYDLNQTTVVKQWNFKRPQAKYDLNVLGIKKGSYVLVVSRGDHQQGKQLIIE